MRICTWNSQGNPLNDAIKLNILNHLLTAVFTTNYSSIFYKQ